MRPAAKLIYQTLRLELKTFDVFAMARTYIPNESRTTSDKIKHVIYFLENEEINEKLLHWFLLVVNKRMLWHLKSHNLSIFIVEHDIYTL